MNSGNVTRGNGITNIDIEKFSDNGTNDDLKKALWVFIPQIQ